jgi:hypothetical protein
MARVQEDLLEEEAVPAREETIPLDIPHDRRRVYSEKSDLTIYELYSRFLRGDLIVQPEFQRFYVWDDLRACRLIESILLEIPIPVVYLAEEEDGKLSVIDGQQRLVSLFRFFAPLELGGQRYEKLELRGLQVMAELNGLKFEELPKSVQRKFENSTLRVIEIRRDSAADVKYEIFARLNTGSVRLNDQELRNCIYRGPYNDFLARLSEDPQFLRLLGLTAPHSRMIDRELILRFFAIYRSSYLGYKPPMRQFLNKEMNEHRNISDREQRELERVFTKSVELSTTVFGVHSFRRFVPGSTRDPNGHWEEKKVNKALYDIIMWGFTQYEKHQVVPHSDAIREELIWLMTHDQDFIRSITVTTDKREHLEIRFDKWRESLRAVLDRPRQEPRAFTLAFKQQIWEASPTCALCQQRIHLVDDAEVDHVEQYWRGGATIPSNARLTHRYCNRARGGRA